MRVVTGCCWPKRNPQRQRFGSELRRIAELPLSNGLRTKRDSERCAQNPSSGEKCWRGGWLEARARPGQSAELPNEPHLPPNRGQGHPSCCASMIMSPFVLDRNVPLIGPPRGGQIGADGDEQEGVGNSRSTGASAQQAAAGGGCGAADARELPAGEAGVEAVSGGRRRGSEAPQRGTAIELCLRGEVSAEGAAAGAREVRWAGR